MRKIRKNSLFASIILAVIGGIPAYADTRAAEVVRSFHQALSNASSAGTYDNRLTIVTPSISKHFQIQTIARISLGRYWQSLSSEQQADYQALLAQLISSTYASRFNQDNGQVFSITTTETITANRMRVKSILKTATDTVTLDYQLQSEGDDWRIYDIVANGVSDLSLKRSNYSSLYKQGGLESVEQDILATIKDNAADKLE